MTNHTNGQDQLRDGARQVAQGASQVAGGAKDYFTTTIAPKAKQKGAQAREQYTTQVDSAGGLLPLLRNHAQVALIPSAALLMIGLFLPLGSRFGESYNYMSAPESDGIAVLLVLLVMLAGQILLFLSPTHKKALRITTGVLAVIMGPLGLYGALANADLIGMSLALAAMGLGGFGLLISGVLTLMGRPDTTSTPAPTDS